MEGKLFDMPLLQSYEAYKSGNPNDWITKLISLLMDQNRELWAEAVKRTKTEVVNMVNAVCVYVCVHMCARRLINLFLCKTLLDFHGKTNRHT